MRPAELLCKARLKCALMQRSPEPRKRLQRLWPAALLLALFLAALLPSALRLATKGQDAIWTQVCTPHGMRWVAIAGDVAQDSAFGDASSSKSQAAMGLLDCPLCLPPVATVQWQGLQLRFASAPLAPAPLLRHWRPPLRAPPVFSLV